MTLNKISKTMVNGLEEDLGRIEDKATAAEQKVDTEIGKVTTQLAQTASKTDLNTINTSISSISTKVNDPLRRRTHVSFLNPLTTEGQEGDIWLKINPFYTFESDAKGSLPVGWSTQFGSGFSVQTIDGTKAIYSSRTTITRSALKTNDVGIVADSDIKADVYVTIKGSLPSLASRISGVAGTENVYTARLNAGTVNSLELFKYVNGAGTMLAVTGNLIVSLNTWYTLRFKTEGTTLKAKVWERTLPEPAEWTLTATDSSLVDGAVGIFEAFQGTCYFDNWELLG